MNEFVSQFLLEARELTEQATKDLLALEQNPSDSPQLDSAFRAFHTLKGAAAIMEYGPMERMLHRAEDILQGLRREDAAVTPSVIDGCLACVGQVIRWLDAIQRDGELPADADEVASRIARQMQAPAPRLAEPSRNWVEDLIGWAKANSAQEVSPDHIAIRYEPATDTFFKNIDPVALIEKLPGIAAVRVRARNPWPSLEQMQPFDCNLIIEATSSATLYEIERALGAVRADVQIVEKPTSSPAVSEASEALATILIRAQADFVRTPRHAEAFVGAIGSAGRVVANILRSIGRHGEVATIETSLVRVAADGNGQPFLDAVARLLVALQPKVAAASSMHSVEARSETGASAIRVDVEKIDAIVDLTGELLVVRNALMHLTRLAAEGVETAKLASDLRTQTSRLERHVTGLQRAVLDLRVLPLGRLFNRFPLLVRETASKLGKQVTVRSEGDDTVADKAIVEALFEPLLHVVRNAIDHGIETAAGRTAAGKPATADILMRAWREGEHVLVEVSDDGRGVETSVVRRLAISRGVVAAEAAATLDETEALELIFAPGFTTASVVTELSGRGVGMNAVRSAVQRIGGEVSLTNRPGEGLTVRFTLPFTVMMTRVMTVQAGGQVFGLPFDAVLETVRVPRSQIKPLGGGEALVLRDTTLPILDLASNLELDMKQKARPAIACLVIASVGGQRVGIEIDRPGERLDLMLKPVEGLLAGMKAISGTSLLGDGRVLIVLDLGALFG